MNTWDGWLSEIGSRASNVLGQLNTAAPAATFAITTGGGADFSVNASIATLEGTGWVDVCEIFIAGQDQPLRRLFLMWPPNRLTQQIVCQSAPGSRVRSLCAAP